MITLTLPELQSMNASEFSLAFLYSQIRIFLLNCWPVPNLFPMQQIRIVPEPEQPGRGVRVSQEGTTNTYRSAWAQRTRQWVSDRYPVLGRRARQLPAAQLFRVQEAEAEYFHKESNRLRGPGKGPMVIGSLFFQGQMDPVLTGVGGPRPGRTRPTRQRPPPGSRPGCHCRAGGGSWLVEHLACKNVKSPVPGPPLLTLSLACPSLRQPRTKRQTGAEKIGQ